MFFRDRTREENDGDSRLDSINSNDTGLLFHDHIINPKDKQPLKKVSRDPFDIRALLETVEHEEKKITDDDAAAALVSRISSIETAYTRQLTPLGGGRPPSSSRRHPRYRPPVVDVSSLTTPPAWSRKSSSSTSRSVSPPASSSTHLSHQRGKETKIRNPLSMEKSGVRYGEEARAQSSAFSSKKSHYPSFPRACPSSIFGHSGRTAGSGSLTIDDRSALEGKITDDDAGAAALSRMPSIEATYTRQLTPLGGGRSPSSGRHHPHYRPPVVDGLSQNSLSGDLFEDKNTNIKKQQQQPSSSSSGFPLGSTSMEDLCNLATKRMETITEDMAISKNNARFHFSSKATLPSYFDHPSPLIPNLIVPPASQEAGPSNSIVDNTNDNDDYNSSMTAVQHIVGTRQSLAKDITNDGSESPTLGLFPPPPPTDCGFNQSSFPMPLFGRGSFRADSSLLRPLQKGQRRNVSGESHNIVSLADDDADSSEKIPSIPSPPITGLRSPAAVKQKKQRLPCDLCDKTFSTVASRTRHMRIHNDIRPYECQYCGKRFRQNAHLKKHIRLHTGEKPHACPFCAKRFTQKSTLTGHVRTKHTKETPVPCPKCDARFPTRNHLRAHREKCHKDD